MADALSQAKRLFSFDSPLGETLLCNHFSGEERISDPFKFHLELASEDFDISWDQVVGRNATVGIRHYDGVNFRYFNGFISRFAPDRNKGRLAYYKAELSPWLWFLSLTQDCLIYQNLTVPQVIQATFDKYGFQDYQFKLNDASDRHKPWEYCCQYRETALEFVSRLMETEGIYYYFTHEQGKHKLIMVDDLTAHVPCPYQSAFRYAHSEGAGVFRTDDTIDTAVMHKVVKPSAYRHKEFNFLKPDAKLEFHSTVEDAQASRQLEVYDYPGEFEEVGEGRDWSVVRQEEQECDRVLSHGTGDGRAMTPGFRFTLLDHDREEQNLDYLIVSVHHEAQECTLLPGTDEQEADYSNSWTAIPWEVQYRPKRKTDKAQMLGAQTAWVVGPKGEEIYTDQYGRVKVQFHWDREGTMDQNSSCWIRVMQPVAGPGFGHIWIPRIGQEVIVDFLEGDPDRPMITGCVYNMKNMPPYKLPDNKAWSGIKTRSTMGGSEANYNELRFVDTKDSELYVMHGEKDMEITVNHDVNEIVGHDRTLQVKHDRIEQVQGDNHDTVKGESRWDVGKDLSVNVAGAVNEKAGGNFILEAAGDIHLKAGGQIILEAAQGVRFLGTGAFIDITDQVIVQGRQILMNCAQPQPSGALRAQPLAPSLPTYQPVQPAFVSSGSTTQFASSLPAVPPTAPASSVGGSVGAISSMPAPLASNPYVSGYADDSGDGSDSDAAATDDGSLPEGGTGEPDVFD
jgi:type VI secretion system secreted protein VgrG